jgi:hypothetical protein
MRPGAYSERSWLHKTSLDYCRLHAHHPTSLEAVAVCTEDMKCSVDFNTQERHTKVLCKYKFISTNGRQYEILS